MRDKKRPGCRQRFFPFLSLFFCSEIPARRETMIILFYYCIFQLLNAWLVYLHSIFWNIIALDLPEVRFTQGIVFGRLELSFVWSSHLSLTTSFLVSVPRVGLKLPADHSRECLVEQIFHLYLIYSFYFILRFFIHNCITVSQRVCLVLHGQVRTSPRLAIWTTYFRLFSQ